MSLKNKSKKEMTIDDLALMVAKGFNEVHEMFSKVDKKFDKVDERFDGVESNLVKIRGDISSLGDKYVSRFEFEKLLVRFIHLEQKLLRKK